MFSSLFPNACLLEADVGDCAPYTHHLQLSFLSLPPVGHHDWETVEVISSGWGLLGFPSIDCICWETICGKKKKRELLNLVHWSCLAPWVCCLLTLADVFFLGPEAEARNGFALMQLSFSLQLWHKALKDQGEGVVSGGLCCACGACSVDSPGVPCRVLLQTFLLGSSKHEGHSTPKRGRGGSLLRIQTNTGIKFFDL